MKTILVIMALLGLGYSAFANSNLQENEVGKVKSCTRYTDSSNETCYDVICEGSTDICVEYSGSTRTINGTCVEAGRIVTNIFEGGTKTTVKNDDGTVTHTYVGVTPVE